MAWPAVTPEDEYSQLIQRRAFAAVELPLPRPGDETRCHGHGIAVASGPEGGHTLPDRVSTYSTPNRTERRQSASQACCDDREYHHARRTAIQKRYYPEEVPGRAPPLSAERRSP